MGRPLGQFKAKPTVRQTERCKAAIQTTKLIQSLQDIALGKREGNPTQVRAASVLLSKVMPDMQSMAVSQEQPPPRMSAQEVIEHMRGMARDELLQMSPAQRRELLEEHEIIELRPGNEH